MPQLEDQSALARRLRDSELVDTQPPRTPQPQLSVIMPAHNTGPWIRETLESLMAQTFTDFELIVVDDHSADETSEVVDEFAHTDPRIRVVKPEGRGGAHARNVGVLLARGRYLAFCDGDDILPERAYAALMAQTTDASPDIVFGDFLKFSPRRTWRPTEAWQVFDTTRTGLTLADEPGLIRHRACWNKVFRADYWREHDIVFPEVPRSNDIVPMTQAYAHARDITLIPDLVYIYRARPGATSMSSRASGTRSLVSYIEQELRCDEILRTHEVPDARRRHGWMMANSDGWVHLTRFLESLDLTDEGLVEPVEPGVLSLIQQLVALIDDDQRPPASQAQRRVVLALCEVGDLGSAALAAQLLSCDPLETAGWFDDWARVLRAIPADSRFTDREEVTNRWILRRLRKAMRKSDVDVPGEALRRLLDELPADALTRDGSLSLLDIRFNRSLSTLRANGPDEFARRLEPVRHALSTISGVRSSPGGAEIVGTLTAREPIELTGIAVLGPNHRLQEIGSAQLAADSPDEWTAQIATGQLDPGKNRSLVLIGRSSAGDDLVLVPVASPTLRAASPVSAGAVELTVGAGMGATVRVRSLEQRAKAQTPDQPVPDQSAPSGWRQALARKLPTRRR